MGKDAPCRLRQRALPFPNFALELWESSVHGNTEASRATPASGNAPSRNPCTTLFQRHAFFEPKVSLGGVSRL